MMVISIPSTKISRSGKRFPYLNCARSRIP